MSGDLAAVYEIVQQRLKWLGQVDFSCSYKLLYQKLEGSFFPSCWVSWHLFCCFFIHTGHS